MKKTAPLAVSLLERSHEAVWALFLLALPVTSLPLLADLTGANTVAPASAIPLVWLALAWLAPFLLRGGGISRLTAPFLGFVFAALLATAAAFLIDIPSFKSKSILSQEIPALATLALGAAFYLVIAAWLKNDAKIRRSLGWINLSGLLLLLWSGVQIYVVTALNGRYPQAILNIQSWLSIQDLFPGRISGFTYEPSWLAHQLNLVYLPYWLAASLRRFSAHRLRLWFFSAENALLVGGILVLFYSFSRIGLLSMLLVLTYLIVQGSRWLVKRVRERILGARPPGERQRWTRFWITILLTVALAAIYLVFIVGLAYGLSQVDERLEDLFNPDILTSSSFYSLTSRLRFAERVVYWATGWRTFNDFPFLGVGLGNAGFFFPDKMPSYGWNLWETTRTFYEWSFIPNTKSLWVRILAETGILGMAFFASWLLLLWWGARAVRKNKNRLNSTMALTGQFAILALLVEGFSIDSFAMPYIWIAMGLLTATLSLSLAEPGETHGP